MPTNNEFEVAVKAASKKKPIGMGDFVLREMVREALVAAEQHRNAPIGGNNAK
jgi:hypothetical protein